VQKLGLARRTSRCRAPLTCSNTGEGVCNRSGIRDRPHCHGVGVGGCRLAQLGRRWGAMLKRISAV